MGFFGQRKSLDELEEENERAELEYSIAQKKQMIKELRNRGGNPSDFKEKGGGINFKKIFDWLKTH